MQRKPEEYFPSGRFLCLVYCSDYEPNTYEKCDGSDVFRDSKDGTITTSGYNNITFRGKPGSSGGNGGHGGQGGKEGKGEQGKQGGKGGKQQINQGGKGGISSSNKKKNEELTKDMGNFGTKIDELHLKS